MTSVTPSNRQPNEGDSLTTSLSGFTPSSTLYFKVSGRGINKKDFAAGALKGKVTVDANGVATITHTLRADKKTEGDELFTIQVFSDKKMRNPLGQSDAAGIGDTSVKAGKASGGEGGEDLATGIYWEIEGFGRIYNDKPISITREQWSRIYQKAATGYGQQVDSESGFEAPPFDSFPIQVEFEITSRQIVRTAVDSLGNAGRDVLTGEFSFTKGRLTELKVFEIAFGYVFNDADEYGEIQIFPSGRVISDPSNFFSIDLELTSKGQEIGSYYLSDSESEGDRMQFTRYNSGKFFYDGWQNNSFEANLI